MDKKRLLIDIAIIAIVSLVGILAYLAIPKSVASPIEPKENNLFASSTTDMPTSSTQLGVSIIKEGVGEPAKNGDTLLVHYTGTLENGTVFDSSIPRGQPFPVTLGKGQVIQGWELGLLGMKVGEERKLVIPPELAYGKEGIGGVIPENATLIFDVQLLEIK